jgi:DNA-binding MarR family transcriptional regulator
MAMSRLADMLDVSLSNATGLIDRVEERGFVERVRVPADRRIVIVRLTPAGVQMLDAIETVQEQILRRVLDQLDPAQLAGVASAMLDLRNAVDASLTGPGSEAHHHAHVSQGRD